MASNQDQQPGLVSAHAEYVKGATEVIHPLCAYEARKEGARGGDEGGERDY